MAKTAALAWPIRSRSRKSDVDAGRAVDAGGRKLLGDLARALLLRLDEPHADVLVEEHAGDLDAGRAGAEDDDVVQVLLAAGHDPSPIPGRVGRADDDDPVAREDRLVPSRDEHRGRPRMMLATFESAGTVASLSWSPTTRS